MNSHKDVAVFASKIIPSGSRTICNPPPTDTDEDYVVLAGSKWDAESILDHMEFNGYSTDGCETYDIIVELDDKNGWASFKKGEVNYIITSDEEFFDKWVLATDIAKTLNLLKKEDRVKLFSFILYDADVYYEHGQGTL